MLVHPLVTETPILDALCRRWKRAPYVAVDTEFMRENTYYADLCLVQVASPDEAAAIDPKAPGLDLRPLLDLLVEDDVLKVFHAGGQDLEIIYNLTGKTPAPLFDTQVAAMALGLGEQVGYTNLVAALHGANLDKGARFTDWARRPLDERQLDYAVADVTYLAELFPRMLERLKTSGRGVWLDEEMQRLGDPDTYASNPETAWTRLRLPNRNPQVLGRLKAVAAWREREAAGRNVPRGRIIKDETLADLVAHPPRRAEDLGRVRGLPPSWATNDMGRRLMAVLEQANPLPPEEMPPKSGARPHLSTDATLVADLLKLLLKIRAKEAEVAPRLIARSDELEAIAAGTRTGLPVLSGWRYEAFGRDAIALVEGRIGFTVRDDRLVMTQAEVEPPEA